jgi:hypothetical protein
MALSMLVHVTSNPVVVSNFVEVHMQQLVVMQAQAITWKPHS